MASPGGLVFGLGLFCVLLAVVESGRVKRNYDFGLQWFKRFAVQMPGNLGVKYNFPVMPLKDQTTPPPSPTPTEPDTTRSPIQQNNNGSNIALQCAGIVAPEIRAACARVALNPLLRGMQGVHGFVGEDEDPQQSFLITRGISIFRDFANGKQIVCAEPRECPDYTVDDRNRDRSLRSLSPWIMCQEFDPNRFPQWLNTARCLCTGCINATTGKENIGDVISQSLTVELPVLRKDAIVRTFGECTRRICREVVERVAIGCHCALADIRDNS